jgi:HPt (histidine-containing phosphotransfer) domain-containing protein
MSSSSPFSLGTNLQHSQRNRRLLEALLNGVRRQLIEDLDRLVRAVAARDTAATERVAHALQDLAGAVEADALRSRAEELASLARAGSIDAAERQLRSLRDEAERCIAYIPVVMKGADMPKDRDVNA